MGLEQLIDDPWALLLGWIAWQTIEKIYKYWCKTRLPKGKKSQVSIELKLLVLEVAAEFGCDKIFIIYHNDKENHYSLMHEFSPRMPYVQRDYQRVPYDAKAHWAMDLLRKEGKIIVHEQTECENIGHRNTMKWFNMHSWYCFKLTYEKNMIGSLNIYFRAKSGMPEIAMDSLIGKVSSMGRLLHKEVNE